MAKWGKVDTNKLKEAEEQAEAAAQGYAEFWKPPVGESTIRILPPHPDSDLPFHIAWLHYGLRPMPVTCPGPDECPVCQAVRGMAARPGIAVRKRVFFNIIDRDDDVARVYVFSAGNTLLKFILKHMNDEDWGDVTDPDDGFDLVIDRIGEGLQTEYNYRFKRKPSALADDDDLDALYEQAYFLEDIAPSPSVDELYDLLDIWESQTDAGSEAGSRRKSSGKTQSTSKQKSQRRQTKPKPRKSSSEEEEEEEEEEEKPKPRRKPGRPRKKSTKDGAEEEEEEEEEEKPKPRRSSKSSSGKTSSQKKPAEEKEDDSDDPDEEKPQRKSTKSKSKKNESEDDEDAEEVLDDLLKDFDDLDIDE